MARAFANLAFRCTGCGACCREPLLPLTDRDLREIVRRTGDCVSDIVQWVGRDDIDLDDEPEAFVRLRQGRRVMVLRHEKQRCRYLGLDDRCSIYSSRPLGCRLYPFDARFDRQGRLKRLQLIQATKDCPYELTGNHDPERLRALKERYDDAHRSYYAKVETWNREQRTRLRRGQAAQTGSEFLLYLGF